MTLLQSTKIDLLAPAFHLGVVAAAKKAVQYMGSMFNVINLTSWKGTVVYVSVAASIDRIVKNAFYNQEASTLDYVVSPVVGGVAGYYAAAALNHPVAPKAAAIFSAIILGTRIVKDRFAATQDLLFQKYDHKDYVILGKKEAI